jgi:hypothetical protein
MLTPWRRKCKTSDQKASEGASIIFGRSVSRVVYADVEQADSSLIRALSPSDTNRAALSSTGSWVALIMCSSEFAPSDKAAIHARAGPRNLL